MIVKHVLGYYHRSAYTKMVEVVVSSGLMSLSSNMRDRCMNSGEQFFWLLVLLLLFLVHFMCIGHYFPVFLSPSPICTRVREFEDGQVTESEQW